MATQTIEVPYGATGRAASLTAFLFAEGSDTVAYTAGTIVEATNRIGVYTVPFTDAAAGSYRLLMKDGSASVYWSDPIALTLTTATFNEDTSGDVYAVATNATYGLAALKTLVDAISAYVDTEVAAIKTVTDQFAAAQAEPTSVPAANATPLEKLAWLAALARNKITQTSTTQTLRNNADSGDIATSTVSDDGATATRGKWS